MSEARISKLEESFTTMQVSFGKIETTLASIDKNLSNVLAVKEELVTHREKLKVLEIRTIDLENENKKQGEAIASINLKIALVTGAWAVVLFILNHFIK